MLTREIITNTGITSVAIEKIALDRICTLVDTNNNIIQAQSGGKDSLVVYDLCRRANIPFQSVHAPTIEFKETIQYLKKNIVYTQQPAKRFSNRIKKVELRGKPITMFTLVLNKGFLPTRQIPFCCEGLKENVGAPGDIILTGLRNEESSKRKKRKLVEFFKGKTMINPIIDWSEEEVWQYIKNHKLPYNPLYDQGFCRVGCPGCPKSSHQKEELERYPEWRRWWLHTIKCMLDLSPNAKDWKQSPEIWMKWWLGECSKQRKEIEGQISLCEYF